MAASTYLFELIKTLSSSEKRYFRLFCGLQGGEKNYLRLFDFIEKQKEFSDQEIRKAFKEELFINNLHVTKNYLYHLLLKCLRSFHSQSNIDQKIGNLISDMLLLEARGLYQQARQILFKAKRLANNYHRHFYLIFLLRKEATYHFAIDEKKMWETVDKINAELSQTNQILLEESQLFILYHKSSFLQRGRTASKEILTELKEQLQEYQTHSPPDEMLSFYTLYLEYCIQAAIDLEEKNNFGRYQNTKKVIQLWQKNKNMREAEPQVYKIHLANFLNAALQTANYEDFPKILEEFERIPSRNFNEAAETFQNLSFYQLLYYLNTKKLKTAHESLHSITKGLEKYRSKISKARELSFFINISILYFLLGDINRALHWLNKILNQPKTDHRKDIQRFAEIMQLFFHYNLNNIKLLENLIVSVRKKIRRWSPLTDFERILFEGLKSILTSLNKKERSLNLKVFQNQLLLFQKGSKKSKPIGFDEVNIWIEKELP